MDAGFKGIQRVGGSSTGGRTVAIPVAVSVQTGPRRSLRQPTSKKKPPDKLAIYQGALNLVKA